MDLQSPRPLQRSLASTRADALSKTNIPIRLLVLGCLKVELRGQLLDQHYASGEFPLNGSAELRLGGLWTFVLDQRLELTSERCDGTRSRNT
jgi:hypothetical protein